MHVYVKKTKQNNKNHNSLRPQHEPPPCENMVCIWKNALTITSKGTVAPLDDGRGSGNLHTRIRLPAWMPEWLDLNFMVPLIATVIVVFVGILVVCVALSRRRSDDLRGGQKDVYCRFICCGMSEEKLLCDISRE